jgi:hypothetical protein
MTEFIETIIVEISFSQSIYISSLSCYIKIIEKLKLNIVNYILLFHVFFAGDIHYNTLINEN